MLIHPNTLKVAKAASTDDQRFTLNSVYITPDGGGVATDGHVLVKFTPRDMPDAKEYPPIEGMEGATAADKEEPALQPFILPSAAAAEILKAMPKKRTTLPILENIALDVAATNGNGSAVMGVTDLENPWIFRPKKIEDQFPDVDKVIPEMDKKPTIEIGLGIDTMLRALNTIKSLYPNSNHKGLRFKFYDANSAIRIEGSNNAGDIVAVVMPMIL